MSGLPEEFRSLPDDPMTFFDLSYPFTERDLKRAYNRWIRRFKPETHPDEFKQIRAAYESLQGDETRLGDMMNCQHYENESAAASTFDADQTPESIYSSLVAKSQRSSRDFVRLAILSDVINVPKVERENVDANSRGSEFVTWLIKGLSHFPSDAGLNAVMRGYLRICPVDELTGVIREIAGTLRSPSFYDLTGGAFRRLLTNGDFERVEKCLAECEPLVEQFDPRPRLQFLLRLLPTAIWIAPSRWSEAIIEELESATDVTDTGSLEKLDFISMLRGYLISRAHAKDDHPFRTKTEAFLKSFCVGSGKERVTESTRLLNEIAESPLAMEEAFPFRRQGDDDGILLLAMIATGVLGQEIHRGDYRGISFGKVNDVSNNRLAVSAMNDLRASLNSVGNSISWIEFKYKWLAGFATTGLFALIAAFVILIPVTLTTGGTMHGPIIYGGAIIAFGIYHGIVLYPRYFRDLAERKRHEFFFRCYQLVWRRRMFRYIHTCHEDPREAMNRLLQAAEYRQETGWMQLVLNFAQADSGLLIFARAQAFVF